MYSFLVLLMAAVACAYVKRPEIPEEKNLIRPEEPRSALSRDPSEEVFEVDFYMLPQEAIKGFQLVEEGTARDFSKKNPHDHDRVMIGDPMIPLVVGPFADPSKIPLSLQSFIKKHGGASWVVLFARAEERLPLVEKTKSLSLSASSEAFGQGELVTTVASLLVGTMVGGLASGSKVLKRGRDFQSASKNAFLGRSLRPLDGESGSKIQAPKPRNAVKSRQGLGSSANILVQPTEALRSVTDVRLGPGIIEVRESPVDAGRNPARAMAIEGSRARRISTLRTPVFHPDVTRNLYQEAKQKRKKNLFQTQMQVFEINRTRESVYRFVGEKSQRRTLESQILELKEDPLFRQKKGRLAHDYRSYVRAFESMTKAFNDLKRENWRFDWAPYGKRIVSRTNDRGYILSSRFEFQNKPTGDETISVLEGKMNQTLDGLENYHRHLGNYIRMHERLMVLNTRIKKTPAPRRFGRSRRFGNRTVERLTAEINEEHAELMQQFSKIPLLLKDLNGKFEKLNPIRKQVVDKSGEYHDLKVSVLSPDNLVRLKKNEFSALHAHVEDKTGASNQLIKLIDENDALVRELLHLKEPTITGGMRFSREQRRALITLLEKQTNALHESDFSRALQLEGSIIAQGSVGGRSFCTGADCGEELLTRAAKLHAGP